MSHRQNTIPEGALEPPFTVVRRSRRRSPLGILAIVPALLGMLVAGGLVWQSSGAAFSGTTSNSANSWTVASVTLTDDDTGAAMFTATNLAPGSTGSKCITVTYGGTTTAPVKLYVAANTGVALQAYLDVVVEEGVGGSFGNCTGYTPTSTLFSGTLASLASTKTTYATGVSSWTPSGAGQTRTYRVTYTLNASTPDAQQGANATATFQWEARTP